jgi:hypothetical protein
MKTRFFLFAFALVFCTIVAPAQAAIPLRPGDPALIPLPNTLTAQSEGVVSITYNEEIDPLTVDPQTFAVFGMQSGLRLQALTVSGAAIRLNPDPSFSPGELVQTSATSGTLSLVDGLGPLEPTVWQFRIATLTGSGFFDNSGQNLLGSDTLGLGIGDLDRDGDLDVYSANTLADFVWVNTGDGTFSDSGQRIGNWYSVAVSLGDLDSDGDLDAFVIPSSTIDFGKVLINNGLGVFSDSGQNLGESGITQVALGDLDGDGDLDAYLVSNANDLVYFNNGNGQFTDSGQRFGADPGTEAVLGDVDLDGDLDALVANRGEYGSNSRLFLNDGQGTLTDSGQLLVLAATNGAALGDLDGDGDLDAFFAITLVEGQQTAPDQVWFNDGNGVFSDSGQRLGTASSNGVALGDIDADGDLDAIVPNLGLPCDVLLNDGAGTFLRAGRVGRLASTKAALGDLDNDGDLDAFLGQFLTSIGFGNEVWFNFDSYYPVYMPLVQNRD